MNHLLVFAYSGVGHDALQYLIQRKEKIVGVVTHCDTPGEHLWFPSVAELAKANNIPVFTPDNPNDPTFVAQLAALQPDFIFSFYYRQMLSEAILNLPSKGALNMHGSLLPQYRGRAPVNWAVIHGEKESGATLHYMVAKPDAGDIVDQEAFAIGDQDTAGNVMAKVRQASVAILARQLPRLKAGTAPRRPQDLSQGCYFGGRSAKDNWIDWNQPAQKIYNLIRSQLPYPQYPGAFANLEGKNWRVLEARIINTSAPSSPGTALSSTPMCVACQDLGIEICKAEELK